MRKSIFTQINDTKNSGNLQYQRIQFSIANTIWPYAACAGSISMIQRRFRVGYARAVRLIEIMEQKHYVSEAVDSKPRKVLLDAAGYNEIFGGEIASSHIPVDDGYYDDDENDCADYENDDFDVVDDEQE